MTRCAGRRPDRGAAQRGILLAELLVTLALSGLVLGALLSALVGLTRWMEALTRRSEIQELVRTVWVVLDEEIGAGAPGRDWDPEGDRALRLRAFRGYGRVCAQVGGDGETVVAWRGLRLPDPARDSLLVLAEDGGWRAAPLLGFASSSGVCALLPGEREGVVSWGRGGRPPAVLVRYFERGRLSLEDGALRYRRGEGGRQPLTLELLEAESRFRTEGGGLWVELVTDRGRGVPAGRFEWTVVAPGSVP